ncbi:MAG: transporter [Candidatus Omnitrophota bacterium]
MRTKIVFFVFILLSVAFVSAGVPSALACESCTIPRLGRQDHVVAATDPGRKWFAHVLFEAQNWNAFGAEEAHELHHDGHHVHNKTHEYFYHAGLGGNLTEDLTVTMDIPWVIRESLGAHHANLGVKEKSEGIGDLTVIGAYRVYAQEATAVRLAGGVKFPTGETDETDSLGDRFEPELQPGSGSYDFILGGVFEHQMDRVILKGNTTYTFKTEGDQDYEFGDVFSAAVFADYVINPDNELVTVKAGVDTNYQYARKDQAEGVKEMDSGGHTILTGPSLTVTGSGGISVYANILFPVLQDLGGVHQELDYVWTVGGRIIF